MKHVLLGILALVLVAPAASARFTERKLESTKEHAEKNGKLIAFVFHQGYALPNCPKCIMRTNANNKALDSAITRADLVVIEIDPDDKGIKELPSIVSGKGVRAPAVIVTDAKCEKVLTKLSGAPDRDAAKAFKTSVRELRGED